MPPPAPAHHMGYYGMHAPHMYGLPDPNAMRFALAPGMAHDPRISLSGGRHKKVCIDSPRNLAAVFPSPDDNGGINGFRGSGFADHGPLLWGNLGDQATDKNRVSDLP